MKRFLLASLLALGLWFVPKPASAINCPIALTFTNNLLLTAAVLNANPVQENICFANIDFRNIGARGIYASQIKPTTVAQAVFGGSSGYTFNVSSPAQVQLTVLGASGQTADLFDVTTTSGSTPSLAVTASGQTNLANGLHVGTTSGVTAPNVGDGVFERGLAGYVYFGSGLTAGFGWNGLTFTTVGTYPIYAQYGLASANATGNPNVGWTTPYFSATGAAQPNTQHGIEDTCTFSSAVSCTKNFTGTGNAFTSTTSFTCTADTPSGSPGVGYISNISGSQISIVVTSTTSATYPFSCVGY